jgi:hypothetical protein
VESVAARTTLEDSDLERDDLLACLSDLLRYKNDQIVVHQISFLDEPHSAPIPQKTESVPPLDTTLFILRWAKGTAAPNFPLYIS